MVRSRATFRRSAPERERVADGVASALFAEDYERTWRRMVGWSNPELRGDEYVLAEDVSPFLADQPEKVKP